MLLSVEKWSMSSVSEMLQMDFSFHELLRTAQNSQRVRVSPQGIRVADKHSLTLNLSDPRDRWIKEILQRGFHLIAIITIDCNNAGIIF